MLEEMEQYLQGSEKAINIDPRILHKLLITCDDKISAFSNTKKF